MFTLSIQKSVSVNIVLLKPLGIGVGFGVGVGQCIIVLLCKDISSHFMLALTCLPEGSSWKFAKSFFHYIVAFCISSTITVFGCIRLLNASFIYARQLKLF